jgi:DNA-binding phage protein
MASNLHLIRSVVIAAKKQGMAQSELARKANMSKEQLSRLLTGTGGARVDTLVNLAAVVGLRVALVPDDDLAADLLAGSLVDFTTEVSS